MFKKLLRVLDAVQRGTGKAGYLLRNDKVKPPRFGVPYHPIEAIPLFRAGAADSFVYVAWYERPVSLALNQFGVILHLIFQTVDLLVLVRGYPGVKRHTQRQVKNRLAAPQFIPYFEYVHLHPPPLSSTQDIGKMQEGPSRIVPNLLRRNRWISI